MSRLSAISARPCKRRRYRLATGPGPAATTPSKKFSRNVGAEVAPRSFHPECCQLSRQMRLEEGMDLAHRQGNPLFGLFPGEDAHFGFRREHRAFHSGG